ncbi:MAG: hypothetical protein KQJ78_09065 [Deltaproteobacteria bacterium]|nr:hypothetical protein [Deltaproteobacteria bacterium]
MPSGASAPTRHRPAAWALTLAVLGCLLAFSPAPARANLRAPVTQETVSGALDGAPAGLVVLSEDLVVTCGADCLVRAEYLIRAAAPGRVNLEFLLPGPQPGPVRVEGHRIPVAVRPEPPRPTPAPDGEPRIYRPTPLWRAAFPAGLSAGDNRLAISYTQPWGKEELKFHGYFSGWSAARVWAYELAPLKAWTLAPAFRLRITLSVDEESAEDHTVVLRGRTGPAGRPETLRLAGPEHAAGSVVFQQDFGHAFPDRLELFLVPEGEEAFYHPPETR